MNEIPKHHMIIECGDFNAHLGEAKVHDIFHKDTSKNGRLLHGHAVEFGLNNTNVMFEKTK